MTRITEYERKIISNLDRNVNNAKALIVGCGKSNYSDLLIDHLGVAEIDFLDYRADNLQCQREIMFRRSTKCGYYQVDLTEADWYKKLKGGYDAILCCEVLEHLPTPDFAVVGIHKMLAEQGRAFFTVPTATSEKIMRSLNPAYMSNDGGVSGHLRIFSSKLFHDLLSTNGFRLIASGRLQSGYLFSHLIINYFRVEIDGDTGELADRRWHGRQAALAGHLIVRAFEITGLSRLLDPLFGRSYYAVAMTRPDLSL
jgi:SAM-dependent methyltransferase